MILRRIFDEIQSCRFLLERISGALDEQTRIKAIDKNREHGLFSWLTPKEVKQAFFMHEKNPELYSFVLTMFDVYLGGHKQTNNFDEQDKKSD